MIQTAAYHFSYRVLMIISLHYPNFLQLATWEQKTKQNKPIICSQAAIFLRALGITTKRGKDLGDDLI